MGCVVVAVMVSALAGAAGIAKSQQDDLAARARSGAVGLVYVGGSAIYAVRADGSSRRRLAGGSVRLHGGPTNTEPSFSPHGSRIVFVRGAGQGGQVWVMNRDGSGQRRLAVGGSPRFSPDGSRILFVRHLRPATSRKPLALADIWVMNADGSAQRRLTHRAEDLQARWSPDGSLIAFQRTTDPGVTDTQPLPVATIWVMNADGSGQHQLTDAAWDMNPVWSPTGDRIAFERDTFDLKRRHGGSGTGILAAISAAIYSVDERGSGLVKLADQSRSPAFSPDGSRIVFMSYRDRSGRSYGEDEYAYNNEIYVMGSDGSRQTRITHSPSEDQNPVWTPDGRAIVFSSNRANYPALTYQGSDPDLYAMAANGGCPLRLTDSSQSITAASVAPSGVTPPAALHASCRNGAAYDNNAIRPEIDTDTTAAAHRYPFPVFYLGDAFDGILLTDVQTFRGSDRFEGPYPSPFFDYSRCATRPGCGPEIQLQLEPICKDGDLRHLFPDGPPDVILRKRGALVLIYHNFDANQAGIYLGDLGVHIDGTDRQINAAITLLRRFGQPDPNHRPLPAPKLPASTLTLISRLQRSYQHTGSIALTAKRFRLDASRLRVALQIHNLLSARERTTPSRC